MDIELYEGDLRVTNGDLAIIESTDAIEQHISIRLKTFLGEWFLDERIGIPYLQSILKKNPNMAVVRSKLKKAILTTPGVIDILEFAASVDLESRILSVDFRAETETGPIDFSEEMILL